MCLWSAAIPQALVAQIRCDDLKVMTRNASLGMPDHDASGTVQNVLISEQSRDKPYPSIWRWPSLMHDPSSSKSRCTQWLYSFHSYKSLNSMCRLLFLGEEPLTYEFQGGVACKPRRASHYLWLPRLSTMSRANPPATWCPFQFSLGPRLTSGSHNKIILRRRRQNIEHSHLPAAVCIEPHHKCGVARKK